MKNAQIWVILIGAIVPLGGYVLNRVGPWVTETVKALVQVALAAVAGALYTALDTDVFGWNHETLQLVLSAVAATLIAHNVLWQPAKVNVKLGATEVSATATAVKGRRVR